MWDFAAFSLLAGIICAPISHATPTQGVSSRGAGSEIVIGAAFPGLPDSVTLSRLLPLFLLVFPHIFRKGQLA
ncbi:MAG: hypothetical protein BM559_12845 [Roseobacter sp. MedPE-SWchi]|nr:MAG: hypothetical protein BM559_12845 [Roseobacter sp. MedPE-SWchi]